MATAEADAFARGAQRDDRETITVTLSNDRQLAYAEYGAPGGDPVVFFHGTPGSRKLGQVFDSHARECGIRVLAPDRPGFGRSTPWSDRSIRDAGRILEPVLDDAGVESAGVVAFSGGAPHALAAAETRSDRVDRLDVIAGATPPDVSESAPPVQRVLTGLATTTPVVLRGLFRTQAWLAARLDPSVVLSQYTAEPDAVPADVAEVVGEDFVESFAQSRRGAVGEFRMAAADWGIHFEDIGISVDLWHGQADTNVPVSGVRRLEERIPGARLRVLDDADHLETLLDSMPRVLSARQ
jgi:pimeloyl-ACP methyl ester carboxylesterase